MGDGEPERSCPVAIVDDQAVSRAGMEQIVSADPWLTVVASVDTVDELDGHAGFDVVVLDLPLRTDESTVAVVTRLAKISRPLVLSAWDRPPGLMATIQAGAYGCATLRSDRDSLATALRVVAHGGFYLCRRLVDRFQAELGKPQGNPNGLTPREVETLRLIALGLTHAQIASSMGLSRATVHTYAKRIRAKLNANNKAQLTRLAMQLGHLTDEHRHPCLA